jgi:hypothetical protein
MEVCAMTLSVRTIVVVALLLAAGAVGWAQFNPMATEQWQPVPPVISPGSALSPAPPSDAIALFDGTSLEQWEGMDGSPAAWNVAGGVLTVKKGTGNIRTKQAFTDYQLHLEWRIPKGIQGSGQLRGNSGVFLGSTGSGNDGYELQILDSYQNQTYVNGQAGAIYKQFAPLVNPMRPPGEWQSYDVIWTAPRFKPDGSLQSPAIVTAFMNGVLIQDHVELKGETVFLGTPSYHFHGPLPIKLQDHPDPSQPISFRNIIDGGAVEQSRQRPKIVNAPIALPAEPGERMFVLMWPLHSGERLESERNSLPSYLASRPLIP